MSDVQVQQETVNVLPDSRAVGKGVAKFVADFKAALKAGNPFETAVQVAQAALQDVAPVLSKLPNVVAEAKADPGDEATTVFLTGRDLYQAIVG